MMVKRNDTLRVYVVFGCVILTAGLVGWKLFMLSYVRHTLYAQTAQAQSDNINNLLFRGNIYIQDPGSPGSDGLYLAATNKKFPLAYVIPASIADPAAAAQKLNAILGIDAEKLNSAINGKSDQLKVVARRLTDEQVTAVSELNMKGVGIRYETDRNYPGGPLLATVLGFLGYGDKGRAGQYGIEAYFNAELSGAAERSGQAPRPADIMLTIDRNIQSFAEEKLAGLMTKWQAKGGTIIVQDPKTGRILAMADRPSFNPNAYSASESSSYVNRSIQNIFEPGSSFKPITMAAGLDMGKVSPNTTYTDPGFIDIAGYKIKNFDGLAHGTVTMTTVLEKSLNTGAAYVQGLLGQDDFLNYVVKFGFGQRTGIDLPAETNGSIANLYSGRQINFVTSSFGQGIAVTPLQLINAYSAIANGGRLMRPYVVDAIRHEGGKTETTSPEVVGIPISEKTSQKLRQMLVSVVDNGFDKARIKGYDIAGKTGTAQIADRKGGYEEDAFIHDFVGFAPASDPRFVVLIKMDRPQGITFAADSLSPTFREIAQYLITYFNIPPTR